MIMTVDELRQFVTTDEADQALEARLSAIELLIRAYTNNNFQLRPFRAIATAAAAGNRLITNGAVPFSAGDTLEVSNSEFMDGCLVTVESSDGGVITTQEQLYDESDILITKVQYPADVKLGAARMLQWQLDNGDKVGVQSETVSRHSVTYFDMSGDNSTIGFPKSLTGFLRPYKRARFGQGLRV